MVSFYRDVYGYCDRGHFFGVFFEFFFCPVVLAHIPNPCFRMMEELFEVLRKRHHRLLNILVETYCFLGEEQINEQREAEILSKMWLDTNPLGERAPSIVVDLGMQNLWLSRRIYP